MQLILDPKGSFLFRTTHTGWAKHTGIIIRENVFHQLNTCNSLQLIIYIDAFSEVAQKLRDDYLMNGDFCDISITFPPLEEALIYKNLVKPETKSTRLLLQLIFDRMQNTRGQRFNNKRITQVLHWIKETTPTDLSIDQLASQACISPSRLRMQFKQLLGVSLHQYLIKHKILSAITLMINGCTIQDAAYRSGFNDSSHLNKLMVKVFDINPSMFIRENQAFSVIRHNNSFELETAVAAGV